MDYRVFFHWASFVSISYNNFKDKRPTRPILICLFICIVSGIVFRYISYKLTLFQKGLDDYFFGYFHKESMTPISLSENIEAMPFDELLKLLKDDFDSVIPFPENLTIEQKKVEEPRLRKYYLELIDFSRKQFDIGVNSIAEVEEIVYKIDKAKTIDAVNRGLAHPKTGYDLRLWDKWRGWLYIACTISFLTAILVLCISLFIALS